MQVVEIAPAPEATLKRKRAATLPEGELDETLRPRKRAATWTDEELDKTLRPRYYVTFPGAKALWEGLPAGAASLRRVRRWVNSRYIGGLHRKASRPIYGEAAESDSPG